MKFETEKENDPYFLTQKIVCGCEIHIVVVAVDVDIDLDVDRLRFIDRGVSGFKPIIGGSRCKGLHMGKTHPTYAKTMMGTERIFIVCQKRKHLNQPSTPIKSASKPFFTPFEPLS